MAVFAVFVAGVFVGATRGVFSLLALGIAIAVVVFASSTNVGWIWACVQALEWVLVLDAGFIVAMVASIIAPRLLSKVRPPPREEGGEAQRTRAYGDVSRPRG